MLLGYIVTLVQGRLHLDNTRNYANINWWLIEYIPRYCGTSLETAKPQEVIHMVAQHPWYAMANSPVVNGVFGWWHCWWCCWLWVQILPLAVIFHGIGLDFIGLKAWIININIHWKQLRLILWTLEIQDRINPTSVKLCRSVGIPCLPYLFMMRIYGLWWVVRGY